MPAVISRFSGEALLIEKATWKGVLRHVLFLIIESLIAGAVCCLFLFLLNYIPSVDKAPSNNVFINLWGFTVYTTIVWLIFIIGWPATSFQGLFRLDKETALAAGIRVLLPGIVIVIIYVFGITFIDDGKTFSYYSLDLILLASTLIIFGIGGLVIKHYLVTRSRMPIDVTGYYRSILIPAFATILLIAGYSLGMNKWFQSSSTTIRFIIRLIIHPILLESILSILRRFVFRIQYTHASHLIVLLVPVQFIGAFFWSILDI